MKKEVLLAVSLGLIVGLVITIGVFRARRAVQENFPLSSNTPMQSVLPSPSSGPSTQSDEIALVDFPDELLTASETLQVSGRTTANATIIILQDGKETISAVDDQGNFSTTITLDAGGNIIVIRLIKPDGTQTEIVRSVIYSSASLDEPPQQATSTPKIATKSAAKATATPKPKAL